jgi:hypothetical protein
VVAEAVAVDTEPNQKLLANTIEASAG